MFNSTIYEDNLPILFETKHPVLFSTLIDITLAQSWNNWELKYFAVRENCTLIYRNTRDTSILNRYDLKHVKLSQISFNANSSSLLKQEVAVIMTCQLQGVETNIRFILDEDELKHLVIAIKKCVKNPIIDTSLLLIEDVHNSLPSTSTNTNSTYGLSSSSYKPYNRSVMRQSLAKAIDKYQTKSRYERIVNQRGKPLARSYIFVSMYCSIIVFLYITGALSFLPVYFDNDLIHGSWWFVIGSILIIFFSIITLYNSYHNYDPLGEDDSHLSNQRYQAIWWCTLISGIFFTLGSLAFVRAMYETPPMRPLFPKMYHISSDELLGEYRE